MTAAFSVREHPKAAHWDVLLRLASRYRDPAWDPWRCWALPAGGRAEPLPPVGPAVYVALDEHRCLWAGQTGNLRDRLAQHLRSPYRRARWRHVAAIKLVADSPAWVVDRLERDVARRLVPVDGRNWPRHG